MKTQGTKRKMGCQHLWMPYKLEQFYEENQHPFKLVRLILLPTSLYCQKCLKLKEL